MKLVVVPGDGIGPEITTATLHAIAALQRRYGFKLDVQDAMLGSAATRTRDLGGSLTTSAFADVVAKHIEQRRPVNSEL
jgi:isocitrate/isopropylmalate dehydrogenase